MKYNTFLLVLILLCSLVTMAQVKPKKESQDKPPTQKEIEAMMKEGQKALDEMSPEDKRMMDSMGIRMPSLKGMPAITDQQLARAYDDEMRIVPARDGASIASISRVPLTSSTLPAFLSAAHARVESRIRSASRLKGEEMFQLIKSQHNSPVEMGNAAAGLWMLGKAELALYVMGQTCISDPSNTDNLNNYASMLSMSGGEELAIPILEKLNRQFPQNSTILNNIGQAWFGLGEMDKAEKYLDSTIRIYAYHPQANYTRSFIEESKGNRQGAAEAVKRSMKNGFTPEKDSRARKLKSGLKEDDLTWNIHMPQDPLGLEKFRWPAFPHDVIQSEKLETEWEAFKLSCSQDIRTLNAKMKDLEQKSISMHENLNRQLLQAASNGVMIEPLPWLAPKASVKLKYLVEGKDGHLAFNYQKKGEAVAQALTDGAVLEEKLSRELEELEKKYEDQFGEGKPNPFKAACADDTKAKNAYLDGANGLLEEKYTDFMNFMRRKINDEVYYYQYTQWPEDFELAKAQAQLTWLTLMNNMIVRFRNKSAWCQDEKQDDEIKPFALQAFDDVHCAYHSSLSTPVGTIRTDCSRMTTVLDLKFVKFGLKQDMDRETFRDQFMNCTVEVGAGVAVGAEHLGPIKAEASIGGSVAMEFDRTGLKDVIVKAAAGISVGTDVINVGSEGAGVKVGTDMKDGSAGDVGAIKDLQVEIGVKGQVSLISGKSSAQGTGILDRTDN